MKILITGGTGFIGRHIVETMLAAEHEILIISRNADEHQAKLNRGDNPTAQVRFFPSLDKIDKNEKIDAVINLAGESIAGKPWSKKQKAILMESRLVTTRRLVAMIESLDQQPMVFISASAIGYYGAMGIENIDERVNAGHEFTSKLCAAWEYEASRATTTCRTVIMRLGLVLGQQTALGQTTGQPALPNGAMPTKKVGGFLARLLLPAKFFISARMGRGNFYMSWIHLHDLMAAIDFFINNKDCHGVYNLTAPNPLPQKEFAKLLAQTIKKPQLFFIPAFIIKILLGEMGDRLLLHGQRVLPKKLLAQKFSFRFPEMRDALADIFNHPPS